MPDDSDGPVVVRTKIDLSDQADGATVSLILRVENVIPERVAFGVELFKGSKFIETVVKFPHDDQPGVAFDLAKVATLRGLSTDCFGRVFPGVPSEVRVWCDFVVRGNVVASSDVAVMTITDDAPSADFHIKCLFQ